MRASLAQKGGFDDPKWKKYVEGCRRGTQSLPEDQALEEDSLIVTLHKDLKRIFLTILILLLPITPEQAYSLVCKEQQKPFQGALILP